MNILITFTSRRFSEFTQESQYDDVTRIGDLAFMQLAELRHRGAFSTVSQTFTASCVAAAKKNRWLSSQASNNQDKCSFHPYVLEKWYQVCHQGFNFKFLSLIQNRMPLL